MVQNVFQIFPPAAEPDLLHRLATDPNAIFAGLVAVFTLALVIIGANQAKQLQRSVNASVAQSKALIMSERPHLLFESAVLHGLVGKTQGEMLYPHLSPTELCAELVFISQGRTPCKIGKSSFLLVVGELPPEPAYGEFHFLEGVWIPVAEPFKGIATGHPKELTGEQRTAIMHGQLRLFLIGMVEYTSVFGEQHVSRFAYRYLHRPASGQAPAWIAEATPAYWQHS